MKISRKIIAGAWIIIFIILLISQLFHWNSLGNLEWYDILISFVICFIICIFGYEITSAVASIWEPHE